ncbi:MAG: DUF2191 domain-containing protein [Myxococcota bacterium]
MRTTIDISDALLTELKRLAHEQRRSFREIVEETLQQGLAHAQRPAAQTPFEVHPHALGLKAGFRGMSLNQLYDQLETETDAKS